MSEFNSMIKKEDTIQKIENVVGVGKAAAAKLDKEQYGDRLSPQEREMMRNMNNNDKKTNRLPDILS
jgi:uncharacterized membrane protein